MGPGPTVIKAGRPILGVPPVTVPLKGARVVVAWKDGPEARRDVSAAPHGLRVDRPQSGRLRPFRASAVDPRRCHTRLSRPLVGLLPGEARKDLPVLGTIVALVMLPYSRARRRVLASAAPGQARFSGSPPPRRGPNGLPQDVEATRHAGRRLDSRPSVERRRTADMDIGSAPGCA